MEKPWKQLNKMRNLVLIFFLIATISTAGAQINIGDKVPDIVLKNSQGKEVSIGDFREKYILVDFWASWCAPCRLGNKQLVKLHNNLDPAKIEIIGISIDTDANKWLKAIAKDKIKFTQLIDPKGFEANTAILFGVDELPAKYLFNPEGMLIEKNPSEEDIMKLIKE